MIDIDKAIKALKEENANLKTELEKHKKAIAYTMKHLTRMEDSQWAYLERILK